MLKGRKHCQSPIGSWQLAVVLVLTFCSLSAWALVRAEPLARQARRGLTAAVARQGPLDSDRLFSPSVGLKFYELAYELANAKEVSRPEAQQAMVFLTATTELDSRAKYILPDMIKLACRYSPRLPLAGGKKRGELVYQLLADYVDETADLEVAEEAIQYLLEQLNSREEREELLKKLLKNLGGKNKALASELATLLGLLMAEKADLGAASFYLMQAYNINKYNKLAFAKLAELVPEQIGAGMYLERLRLELAENPLDMEAALAFAQYAERLGLYQTAVDAYEYCADLFGYLYPSQALPASLYLPLAISSYNTQRDQYRCLQIADELRKSGRFDLFLEAIAGKAEVKIGGAELASQTFKAAENKARQLLMRTPDDSSSQQVSAKQLAWFYCFALPNVNKALDWANKAYSMEPDSVTATAILAYSLVMNGQTERAKPLIGSDSDERNQIAALSMALIQLAEGQRNSAFETLKSVIARDPGSLEAERAKEILVQHGGEYIPLIDPSIILTMLRNSFGRAVVPAFISPEKIISVRLSLRGSRFSYGSKFGGTVSIINNSFEPLVVSDDSLFRGNIRVDADVTGDLNKKIPNLVSVKVRPASPVKPGESILIPLRLVTGELKQILLTYPQASLDIEFTVFVDPVITSEGEIVSRLDDIKPVKVLVERPGVKLTGRYLQNRFNSLTKGQHGQKIKTAQLFVGLLMEQHAMAGRRPLYRFMYADWMPTLLKSALAHNLADSDWVVVVKVHVMAAMLSLPLNHELTDAVSKNLNDTHWPVRMMALYLLTKNQGRDFAKVLDYSAQYDSSKLVRDMAIALGTARP